MENNGSWLADAILHFDLNPKSAADMLAMQPVNLHELALQTIVRNRTAHGGILADGAGVIKVGEAGKGILSRWYPKTLASRIYAIQHIKDRIAFEQTDALQVLRAHQENSTIAFFLDPPYTAGGKSSGSRLYTHSVINHDELFSICSNLKGQFLMTYDNAPEVVALANKYGFETRPVSMKNTHHAEMKELLISRDFNWLK
jgi:DNA adenine methylase